MKPKIVVPKRKRKHVAEKVQVAYIEWTDACILGSEQVKADSPRIKLMEGVSCGIVVRETDTFIALALDYFADDSPLAEPYRVVNVYPKSGIRKIHWFTIPREVLKGVSGEKSL